MRLSSFGPFTALPDVIEQLPESQGHRKSYFRRGVAIVICFAPAILLVASIIYALANQTVGFTGLVFVIIGLLIGVLNICLSFVRPRMYFRRHGSLEGYQFVSGAPAIGTFFIVLGGIFGFGEIPTAVVGLVALALDTGGSPWFLIFTWHDESLWDAKSTSDAKDGTR